MTQEENIALVTGGSRGIGKAIVHTFLMEGFTVIFTGTSKETVEAAMHDFAEYKEKAIGQVCDVTETAQVNTLAKEVKAHGRLNVLVNNAGVFVPDTFAEGDASVLRKLMEINVFGTYAVSQAVYLYCLKQNNLIFLTPAVLQAKKRMPMDAVIAFLNLLWMVWVKA